MQTMVRTSSREVLPMVEFFKKAASEGHLVPPALPATVIADYLDGDSHP